jgi:hypothetical protein
MFTVIYIGKTITIILSSKEPVSAIRSCGKQMSSYLEKVYVNFVKLDEIIDIVLIQYVYCLPSC